MTLAFFPVQMLVARGVMTSLSVKYLSLTTRLVALFPQKISVVYSGSQTDSSISYDWEHIELWAFRPISSVVGLFKFIWPQSTYYKYIAFIANKSTDANIFSEEGVEIVLQRLGYTY